MNIFMYWENPPGGRKPPYLDLCFRTIEKHRGCFKVVLLDDKTIGKYLTIPPFYKKLTIVERADWMRVELLKRYGGLWLDSDTIVLKSLTPIYKLLRRYEFVSFGPPANPQTGVLLSRKNSAVMQEWSRRMESGIGTKCLVWGEFGPILLGTMKREGMLSDGWGHIPEKYCYPVKHQDSMHFLKNIEPERVLHKETYLAMLFNRKLYKRLVNVSEHSIMKSGNLLGQLLRLALKDED